MLYFVAPSLQGRDVVMTLLEQCFGMVFSRIKESSPIIMVTRNPYWSFRDSKQRTGYVNGRY